MKHFYYFLSVAVSLMLFVAAMAFMNTKKELPDKHLEVVLRNIGHELLLHSKDSTSRVLPVKMINERTYQISFENGFGFTPDTLMRLVHQQLTKTDMPKDYIVSVNDCHGNKTIFAFEINTFNGDLKPCGGREQETGCYLIQIEFLANDTSFNYAWLLTAFVPIAFAGFYLNRQRNKPETDKPEVKETIDEEASVSVNDNIISEVLEYKELGAFRFYDVKGMLCLNDATIELSEKEIKALSIFASNQNMVVERDRLRQEIWEAEGVFVINRNVDVLVSKLRKKLSGDPSVKIVNVHGKGYRFIIE
ncbi:helix-turn-helix domain-containing protein [Moheibacter sediminis]|uniref:Transcriptional regulatory protein, C terminal n=1 Tax=Moheibacter sediminis TaxID=1434700 RepID=A0A1W1Z2P9_9FLAO|nr:helix-turn-helix domain-containing protein [Moheibacter sediminis]SMC42361.1 Transcriptional regulatory protein, C terminal [Moheibacter sediminis]